MIALVFANYLCNFPRSNRESQSREKRELFHLME